MHCLPALRGVPYRVHRVVRCHVVATNAFPTLPTDHPFGQDSDETDVRCIVLFVLLGSLNLRSYPGLLDPLLHAFPVILAPKNAQLFLAK